jgi:archaemetzincin
MPARALSVILPILFMVVGVAVYSCMIHSKWDEKPMPEYSKTDKERAAELMNVIEKLRPLHLKLGRPRSGDWLDRFDEAGQTFKQYLRYGPERPIGERQIIYIQPLGDFTVAERKIVKLSAEFMGLYFDRPVKILKDLPLSVIPGECRRLNGGKLQILTSYILEYILPPRLPDNGAVCIAFTATDLWPGKGWNFVFGQASLRERVGVWSINRNGDPGAGAAARRLCLLRTIKTATHETGHMFSMHHCIKYECNMCGSNHREESDRNPLALCPECMAKICWATKTNPLARYRQLKKSVRKTDLIKRLNSTNARLQ